MTAKTESVSRRIKAAWAWVCHVAVLAWRWVRQQWDAMARQSPGEASQRQARRAEKQRRKELKRQVKEKAVRQAA